MVDRFIREFVLLPGACRQGEYSSRAECDAYAAMLATGMRATAFVRNLRDGGWMKSAVSAAGQSGTRWQKLLQKWVNEGRTLQFPVQLGPECKNDAAWAREGELGHSICPLCAVVGPPGFIADTSGEPSKVPVPLLADQPVWSNPAESLHISRTEDEWLALFTQLRRVDRRMLLIDKNLSPGSRRYRPLGQVLERVAKAEGGLDIEFHRLRMETDRIPGSPPGADVTAEEWRSRFRSHWDGAFRSSGVRAKVVLWRERKTMHARFLLTKALGLHPDSGFEVGVPEGTTITCLDAFQRNRLYSERDPNAHLDSGVETFEFGAGV